MIAVILGAFGAHALKNLLIPERLATFETGVRYQFYHALALVFIGVWQQTAGATLRTALGRAGILFSIGILLFSGSIYVLATRELHGFSGVWLGALTPVGGLFFIAGWAYAAVLAWRD